MGYMLVPSPRSAMPASAHRSPRSFRRGLLAALVGGAALAAPAGAAASSMSITGPAEVLESTSAEINVKASLDAAAYVEVKIRPVGAPCAPNAASDPGSLLLDRSAIEATFAATAVRGFEQAGQYLVCGWARDTTTVDSPVVASASTTLTVRPPKLSLAMTVRPFVPVDDLFTVATVATAEIERFAYVGIVPNMGQGCPANYGALQRAKGSVPVLDQAGIKVVGGPMTIREQISMPKAGKFLACGYFHHGMIETAPQATAKVEFVVAQSCEVPVVAGTTLARAKKLLKKANCTVGKTKKAKSSKVKKGRVVKASKKAGTVLAPGATVALTISKG